MDRPELIEMAMERKFESPDVSASWVWFFCSTEAQRKAVDAWLVATKHPLSFEPGTPELRFRQIVKELRS